MLEFSGDSVTVGIGAGSVAMSYAGLFNPTRRATSGWQAADLANALLGIGVPNRAWAPVAPRGRYGVLIGINDVWNYKALRAALFPAFLRTCIACRCMPIRVPAQNMAQTGKWTRTLADSTGLHSIAAGNTLTAKVPGRSVYVCIILQNTDRRGEADVIIDGVTVGHLATLADVTTHNGATYGAATYRFDDLEDVSHTVLIQTTAPGDFYVSWVAGANQMWTPKVAVGNIIRMTAAGYVKHGSNDDLVTSYNVALADVFSEFQADDFDVRAVDCHGAIDPDTMLVDDGVHPNNYGHEQLFDLFYAALV